MAPATLKLNNGKQMPQVGFGLWKVNNETCADQVYNAIKTGYRLLDGAADYGNEAEAGQGAARAIKEGIIKREDLFVTSKLWNTNHEEHRVGEACKRGLKAWGLEYFDLFLIHFPVAQTYVDPEKKPVPGFADENGNFNPAKTPLHETWRGMEKLVDDGLAKSIGISNYSGSLILDLLRYCRIKPQVLQIEHHPYLTQPGLIKLCKDEDINVTAYSSFGPGSYIELDMQSATNTQLLMEHPTITKIAEKENKTPAQVLLRWSTQRGIAVIPKSNNQGRLKQNLDVTDWSLKDDQIKEISGLEKGLRFNNPPDYGVPAPIFA